MAATRQVNRTPHTVRPPEVRAAQVRVRWDRVIVLVALLAVVTTVTAHALIGAVRDGVRAIMATPEPQPTAQSTVNAAQQAPAAPPQCPPAGSGIVHTAPSVTDAAARTVALTFDDGPGPATPTVLDILHRNRVPATFFVIGQRAAEEPDMLRQIAADGHALGNHSWSHHIPNAKAGWKRSTLKREIERTNQAIFAATGLKPCLFRPPGGIVKGAAKTTRAAGLEMILWSTDPRDWAASGSNKSAVIIRKRVAAGLTEEHPVILLHDGGGNRSATVVALQGIIDDYRARGYQFVTLAKRG
jgi:peptidoglycan/xylan/chitin deacetylase (PgdA/CDA1 family)